MKRLRKEQGQSQEELAEKINKTVDTVSSMERGLSFPRLDTALALADVFNIHLHELFDLREPGKSHNRQATETLDTIHNLLRDQPLETLVAVLKQIILLLDFKNRLVTKNDQKKP